MPGEKSCLIPLQTALYFPKKYYMEFAMKCFWRISLQYTLALFIAVSESQVNTHHHHFLPRIPIWYEYLFWAISFVLVMFSLYG